MESLGTPAYVHRCHKMLFNTGRSPYGMGSGFQHELQDIAIAFSLHIQFLQTGNLPDAPLCCLLRLATDLQPLNLFEQIFKDF